jgi:hypothetical protein
LEQRLTDKQLAERRHRVRQCIKLLNVIMESDSVVYLGIRNRQNEIELSVNIPDIGFAEVRTDVDKFIELAESDPHAAVKLMRELFDKAGVPSK